MSSLTYLIYVTILRESTVEFWEYTKLVATYQSQVNKDGGSNKKLLERGFTQDQIDMMNNKSKSSMAIKSLNLNLMPGFEDLQHPYFDLYYSLFELYNKGTMPFDGSPLDQPNKIIDIFGILQALKSEFEKAAHEEQLREMQKGKK